MKKISLMILMIMILYGNCRCQSVTPEAMATVEAVKATVETVAPTKEAEKSVVVTEKVSAEVVYKPTTEAEKPSVAPKPNKFVDVPDDHWAANSVYDLVNMGVTQGYPDGTFRGNRNITRYETAMFLSKLANAIGKTNDYEDIAIEKLKDDLRAEIRSLRAEIAELKRIPEEGEEKPISGSYSSSIIFGNLIATSTSVEGEKAPVGPIVRYRLKTTFARNLSDSAKVKVNIDTMDSGFGGGSSDLSTKILDVQGDMKLNLGLESPVDVRITSGPGPVAHTEEADVDGNFIARPLIGVVYVRPWNSIMFSSKMMGLDMGLGYIARKLSALGEVEVNQIKGVLGYNFPGMFFVPSFRINTNIDYLSSKPQTDPAGPTDTKMTFDISYPITQKLKSGITYSVGQGTAPHNALFGMNFDLLDMWDSGTTISLKYRKVGAEYLYENAALNEDLFAGLDVFDRYIGNGNGQGVVDIGSELKQVITETINLFVKSDYRLGGDNSYGKDVPQCSLNIAGGFDWYLATDSLFQFMYQVESIPSAADQSTDMTQFSLSFKY